MLRVNPFLVEYVQACMPQAGWHGRAVGPSKKQQNTLMDPKPYTSAVSLENQVTMGSHGLMAFRVYDALNVKPLQQVIRHRWGSVMLL